MNIAKVWNDNTLPFKQKWKDQDIFIPAKGFIEMEYDEAHAFKSYPYPIEKDGMGQQAPHSYKMIRVEGKPHHDTAVVAFKSQADGSLHLTREALDTHDAQYSHRRAIEVPSEAFSPEEVKKPGKKKTEG